MTKKKTKKSQRPQTAEVPREAILTFRQHLQELRKRIIYVVFSIGVWSIVTYIFERQTVNALLRPARHQQFIYTSPIGGINFMFSVSLYVAIILSLPVIVYNILAFITPLLKRSSLRFIVFGAIISAVLAAGGLVFGYFIGLPSAMHFLLHQFVTSQIKPLLTVQAYLSFVMIYMLGSALMLQIPLILIFINRIRPLKPKKLLHYERWVILGAFIMSAIMNPTPNVLEQLLVAGPLILMYQIGILIIALMNRGQDKQQPVHEAPPQTISPKQYAQPSQPAILSQFREIAASQPAPRAVTRPVQRATTKPPSRRYFDVVNAPPTNRRPERYIGRSLDEEATA